MARSLCTSCVFVRQVHGRRDQVYLLCRNPAIESKYPRQPVLECAGYEPAGTGRGATSADGRSAP